MHSVHILLCETAFFAPFAGARTGPSCTSLTVTASGVTDNILEADVSILAASGPRLHHRRDPSRMGL